MTAAQIASAASCYGCMDDNQFSAAVVYLLNQTRVANGGAVLTPAQIAANAACYCVPDPLAADVYLLQTLVP